MADKRLRSGRRRSRRWRHTADPDSRQGHRQPTSRRSRPRWLLLGTAALLILTLPGCRAMHLMEAMLGTSEPNEKVLGQMFAMGGGGRARIGSDGIARITVIHEMGDTLFKPAVIMVDRPGPVEILFSNNNPQSHLMLVVPSDGNMMALDLPPLRSGLARVNLGTPGMYMFADAIGDHMGRGMMGMILVEGEVPPEARLDRPRQPQP